MDDPLAHLLDAGLDLSQERRYMLERELGRGSMGVVYQGRDLLLDRPVAVKVMAGSMVTDGDLRRYFEREARAAGRLSHRNVVTVHDFGYDGRGAPFVVMELLRGRDLRQMVLSGGPLSIERRLAIVLQVLAGLAHAHSSGVVHRDVKPANVFITDEGVVKLLDFGIARLPLGSLGNSSDAVMGTADYMSPEQVLGGEMDGRSDVFSCGALLFELLIGHPPFHAESFVTIAYRVVHEEPDYSLLPAACRGLEPVLRKAMSKARDDRYPSALDFATDMALSMGVGVAPETIQPAPAWTIPLPKLVPAPEPAPTVSLRERGEEPELKPPDHSSMRPGWPLRAPHDHDEPPPRARGRHVRVRRGWAAAAAVAAAIAFATGAARWRTIAPSTPPVAGAVNVPAGLPAATSADAASVPTPDAPVPQASGEAAALIAPEAPAPVPSGRPIPGEAGSFWSTVPATTGTAPAAASTQGVAGHAPAPVEPPDVEPPRVLNGRWTGFVTDDFCRDRGAVNDHGQCLETCLRRGRQALISIDGQLYKLIGVDRIRGLHDRRVVVEGQLDVERRALTVNAGWPAR